MDYHPRILSFCEKHLSSKVSTSKTNSQTTMARHKSRRKYLKMDTITICFLSIIILQTLASCAAEQIFHARDHSDISEYSPPQHKFKVTSLAEAGNYLVRYGYVDCTTSRRKRDTMTSPLLAEMNPELEAREETQFAPQEVQQCTKSQIRQGLIKFQEKWGLTVTGDLEAETLQKMNSQRCGNKDTEKKPPTGAAIQNQALSKKPANTRTKRHAAEIVSENIRNRLRQRITIKGNEVTQEPIDDDYSLKRRKRQLQEIKEQINNGELKPEPVNHEVARKRIRKKRSAVVDEEAFVLFENDEITWQLQSDGHSVKIPIADQKAALRLAFRMWSEVCPLTFKEVTGGDVNTVDIMISFGTMHHGNCGKEFDGQGGANAHSWAAGDMHFDDDEEWKEEPDEGVYLVAVAVHELGHVLNLNHTLLNYSVMFPYYDEYVKSNGLKFELGSEDRIAVQRNYGVCKGRFDAVFDWVRVKPSGTWVYNTYFFRKDLYWMYENRRNRTRYGDPLTVFENWKNLPNELDAYTQAIYYEGFGFEWKIITMFFKGEDYYLYDNVLDRVKEGYPRKIAEDFGSTNTSLERIPDNLDAAIFDSRITCLLFFKDQWVWIYNLKLEPELRGRNIQKMLFTEMFPMASGETEVLDGYLDSAYYSQTDQMMYFLKGEDLYKNVLFSPFRRTKNLLKKIGNWWDKWLYICQVD